MFYNIEFSSYFFFVKIRVLFSSPTIFFGTAMAGRLFQGNATFRQEMYSRLTGHLMSFRPKGLAPTELVWKDRVFAIQAEARWLERCGTDLCANINR
jgi:hypothetical protein